MELRKSKRREEKLTALQFRLKEDVQLMGLNTRCDLVTTDDSTWQQLSRLCNCTSHW